MAEEKTNSDAYDSYLKERYSNFLADRNNLDERAFKTSERYDQWVVTLAGGALGISITFLEKIASNPSRGTLIILGLSWLSFICAILAGFCAIYFSRRAIYRAIDIRDEEYNAFLSSTTEENPTGDKTQEKQNTFIKTVGRLNNFSLCFLISGTLFLCAFALVNISNAQKSKENEKNTMTVVVNIPQINNSITNVIELTAGKTNLQMQLNGVF